MHIQLAISSAGQFHTTYWDLNPGDVVDIEDRAAHRYIANKLATRAPKVAQLHQHWAERIADKGQIDCTRCSTCITLASDWDIPRDLTEGRQLYRVPVHTRCIRKAEDTLEQPTGRAAAQLASVRPKVKVPAQGWLDEGSSYIH